MTASPHPIPGPLTIAEVVERTGLSKDTLRWYERQGLIPPVGRTATGHRAYDDPTVRMIELIVRLRRTGMPVGDMKAFVTLVPLGAASQGRRMALLEDHRGRVRAQLQQLQDDLTAIETKIDHYGALIAAGQDCAQAPVTDPAVRRRQGSRT